MRKLLTAPMSEIGSDDIDRLITNQEPESSSLELKVSLPCKGKGPEPWQSGENKISDHSRNVILSEVVGMANSGGGIVLLGVEETKTKPGRAKAVIPIKECKELAERLGDMAWSVIDPRLPSLEIKGIPYKPDGSGVVLLRVGSSLRAPHGLNTTRYAYVRRGTSTEKMFVREIQEKTIQSFRGLDWVENQLRSRSTLFRNWIPAPKKEKPAGIRATVIPTTQSVALDKPYAIKELWPPPRENHNGTVDGNEFQFRFRPSLRKFKPPQPILRGSRRELVLHGENSYCYQEVHWNGLVDMWYQFETETFPFFAQTIVAVAIEAFRLADAARTLGGAPSIEMILEVELIQKPGIIKLFPLCPTFVDNYDQPIGQLHSPVLLPRAPIIGDDFQYALKIVVNDLLNAFGNPSNDELSLDMK